MIDERHVCSSERASTICYFFFRDGQAERERGANALKAFSHQLLKQHPRSNLIRYLLPKFEAHGDRLGGMFSELWDSMLKILSDPAAGEVVLVLDALDECTISERKRLLECLTELYSSEERQNSGNIKLKTLITSRQYHDIEVGFWRPKGLAGYIQLDGDEKSQEISQEITLVIEYSVPRVAPSLSENDQAKVIEHLKGTAHRTYLWLHLMLKEIEHNIVAYNTEKKLASIIKKLPTSVYDAYERILERSTDRESARKILQIVIAAKRALTVSEMNVALALALQGRCSSYNALDRPSDQEFKSNVKQICGIFVSIIDQKVYLLHQTAREFLLCQPGLASQGWQHSLSLESGHSLLFRICVYLLCFSEFESPPWDFSFTYEGSSINLVEVSLWIDDHILLRYAAKAWMDHYHQVQGSSDNDLIEAGLKLCNTSLKKFVTWRAIYGGTRNDVGDIHVACRIGWHAVVERMLIDGVDVNLRTDSSRVRPLHAAIRLDNNYAVVKRLLDRGADVNAEDDNTMRPLSIACSWNAVRVAEYLLDNGADIDAGGHHYTALFEACRRGKEELVRLLLRRGANVELGGVGDGFAYVPLLQACRSGFIMIAQDLIAHGADINRTDSFVGIPLALACYYGYEAIARLLIQKGVDIEAVIPPKYLTALGHACSRGHEAIVRLLLDSGAKANMQSAMRLKIEGGGSGKQAIHTIEVGISPMHGAALEGSVKIAQLLIDHGADVNTQDDGIGTPLILAAYKGLYPMVEFLLNKGADILATCDYFVSVLVAAAQGSRHRGILQLLLSHGAQFYKSDWESLRNQCNEGRLRNLDTIYEQVKDKDKQETIEVLMAAEGLISRKAKDLPNIFRADVYDVVS